ncbi:MAG TPA: RibD family protein, partial [Candidatus Cloacimonadota bacterium]|nr:RibD family protein [Candidatus Cloacimonadota bacterium]
SMQNEAFICNIVKKRPFVTWKCALSLDGKYSAQDGSSQWISNDLSRRMVHRMRAKSDAVLAGINSVIKDDAMLNARGVKGHKQPLRVVLDPFLDLSPSSRFAQIAPHSPALVFHCSANTQKEARLHALGIQTSLVPGVADEIDLNRIMSELQLRNISSIFLETGNRLSEAFWRARLVDKCVIFYGNMIIGGARSCLHGLDLLSIANAIPLEQITVAKYGQNIMLTGYPVY